VEPEKTEFDDYAESYTELHRNSIAASGEDPSFFSAFKADYVANSVKPSASGAQLHILDFGCGIGNSTSHLREAFPDAKLFGADPSSESIRIARERAIKDVEFVITSDSGLLYKDGSFDVVFVACVFHHIAPAKRLFWMRELRRVTKSCGHIYIFEHNMLNPLTVKAVKDCPFDEHAILLPSTELMTLAKSAGFTVPKIRYVIFFPRMLAFLRPFEKLLVKIPFGAQYVLQAMA